MMHFDHNFLFKDFYAIIYASMYFIVALRIIFIKRPFVIATYRIILWSTFATTITWILNPQYFFLTRFYLAFGMAGLVCSALLLLWFICQKPRKYQIYGITKSVFTESLKNVLNQLSLSFEEDETSIHIPSQNVTLVIKAMGDIISLNMNDGIFAKQLITALRQHYLRVPVTVTRKTSLLSCILVIVAMLSLIWLFEPV